MRITRLLATLALTLFPTFGLMAEPTADTASATTASETVASKINVNSASAEELTALKGIGSAKAAAIVQDRETNGPFASLDELVRVRGIGPATVDNNRLMATAE